MTWSMLFKNHGKKQWDNMKEDKIRQILEEASPNGEIPTQAIEEIVNSIKETKQQTNKVNQNSPVPLLKIQMDNCTDWRDKCKIAAEIIGLSLSE